MTHSEILIDCDPGIDDAIMLILAFCARVPVRAITTLGGNVSAQKTRRNARMICELMDAGGLSVTAGCGQPLLREPVLAAEVHGPEGLLGIDIFEPSGPVDHRHGVDVLREVLRETLPGRRTIVATGPLTNIAAMLAIEPDLKDAIKRLVVMGGASASPGNITPFAEFNFFCDPHAAEIVFRSGVPVHVVNLDVTRHLLVTGDLIEQLSGSASKAARLAGDLMKGALSHQEAWKEGMIFALHDPATLAYLLRPDLFTGTPCRIAMDLRETEPEFGRSIVTPDEAGPHLWLSAVEAELVLAFIRDLMEGT